MSRQNRIPISRERLLAIRRVVRELVETSERTQRLREDMLQERASTSTR